MSYLFLISLLAVFLTGCEARFYLVPEKQPFFLELSHCSRENQHNCHHNDNRITNDTGRIKVLGYDPMRQVCTLSIKDTQLDDSGWYKCGSNSQGFVSVIRAAELPSILNSNNKKVTTISTPEKSLVELTCNFSYYKHTANGTPTLMWENQHQKGLHEEPTVTEDKSGKVTISSRLLHIAQQRDNNLLLFCRVVYNDENSWVSVGELFQTVKLSVTKPVTKHVPHKYSRTKTVTNHSINTNTNPDINSSNEPDTNNTNSSETSESHSDSDPVNAHHKRDARVHLFYYSIIALGLLFIVLIGVIIGCLICLKRKNRMSEPNSLPQCSNQNSPLEIPSAIHKELIRQQHINEMERLRQLYDSPKAMPSPPLPPRDVYLEMA